MTLTLRRIAAASVDVAVTAEATTTIGQLARALSERDPAHSSGFAHPTLVLDGMALSPERTVLESRLQSGAAVSLTDSPSANGEPHPAAVAQLLIISGPCAPADPIPLPRGVCSIGRDLEQTVQLHDPLVSRYHAELRVGESVEIVDLGSANGVEIAGQRVERAFLRSEDLVVLGDTVIRVVHGGAAVPDAEGNGELFNRSPRLQSALAAVELTAPEPPSPPAPVPMNWTPLLAPLLLGPALYVITNRLVTLLFLALSPVLLVASLYERRLSARRAHRAATDRYRVALDTFKQQVADAQQREVDIRRAQHPATREWMDAARTRSSLLWSLRPDRPGFLEISLGLGSAASASEVVLPQRRAGDDEVWQELLDLRERASTVPQVPIVAKLSEVGAVGVAGPREPALKAMRSLVAQLTCGHSPAEAVMAAAVPFSAVEDWAWLKWLPHISPQQSPLAVDHLAAGETAVGRLLAAVEELIETRNSTARECTTLLPAVLMVVEDEAPVDRSRLVALSEAGPRAGVHLLWTGRNTERLPAACRAFLEFHGAEPPSVGLVLRGERVRAVMVDTLESDAAERVSRSMAPLVDAAARVQDESDLPATTALLPLLNPELASGAHRMLEYWRTAKSAGTPVGLSQRSTPRSKADLRATVGSSPEGPFTLDLRQHGPHALVGGTTGAGKSEFLQTWVVSLASAHSPERVNFLFVDYKGEAAFGECLQLPHAVGLVSDLNPHLVHRALTSLRAELHHRERILREHKAKDLLELERRGVVDAPPSLVIVVDEFAALIKDVPDFVDGVVDVAQRGRSLGLHLILATQRPAGVIRDNLRANTNLRIALRMADTEDSTDVIGIPDAAAVDPGIPGRAIAKFGPGRLIPFQSAYVGGQAADAPLPPPITIVERPFGAGQEWPPAHTEVEAVPSHGEAPKEAEQSHRTDLALLVATIQKAHHAAGTPLPRKPWLEPLAATYDLQLLSHAENPYGLDQVPLLESDSELVFGLADDPANQRRRVASFLPDRDGAMAVFGTGGSGKSTFLRTLAIAAARTSDGGPCHVYGLDFGAQGLRMLDPQPYGPSEAPATDPRAHLPAKMPHIGSIVAGDDEERVTRMLRMMRDMIDERAPRYAKASASTIAEYRTLASQPHEPRVLLLLDGLASFRTTYETGPQARWFDVFQSIVADGRSVGIHVIMSADRSTALPAGLGSLVQRRLALRIADDGYEATLLHVPRGAFTAETAAGRGFLDGMEVQVAVHGGSQATTYQAKAARTLAEQLVANPRRGAPLPTAVGRLPEHITLSQLPVDVHGLPTLGLEDTSLAPIGFNPKGTLLVVGPAGSGRSTLLSTLTASFRRHYVHCNAYYFGAGQSALLAQFPWTQSTHSVDEAGPLAKEVADRIHRSGEPASMIVVENLPEFLNSPADSALQQLVRAARKSSALLVADGDTTAFVSSFPLIQLIKGERHGIALQPEQTDGDSTFRTSFPRVTRAAFPPGRGFYVRQGRVVRIQCALPEEEGGL
jgi:S-DNA-T family DNA segregation ATPase FtsK/SpoIIIE